MTRVCGVCELEQHNPYSGLALLGESFCSVSEGTESMQVENVGVR